MLKPRESVRSLPTYHPPLGGRIGMRLDFNENTVGCSPRVLARLRDLSAEEIARYPEREPVEAVVAEHLGIQLNQLLLTNGVDEAIHLLCETFLEPGDEALIVVPTFAMYEICATATGATVIPVPAAGNFQFPVSDLFSKINSRTRLIAIANPNNPTGTVANAKDLLEIARCAPQAAILIDEAYFEFYGQTLLPLACDLPNLFVARTFSKAYGMASLRIGVLAGSAEHIPFVHRVCSPYNVNGVALACLPTALSDQPYVDHYVAQVRESRALLQTELSQHGIQFWPSHTNFVLANLGSNSTAFIQSMRTRGILLRDRSRDYGCQGCVRITLGTTDQTSRLLQAIRETLSEIGVVVGSEKDVETTEAK